MKGIQKECDIISALAVEDFPLVFRGYITPHGMQNHHAPVLLSNFSCKLAVDPHTGQVWFDSPIVILPYSTM